MGKIQDAVKSAFGLAVERRDNARTKLEELTAEREAEAARLAAAERAKLAPLESAQRELAAAEVEVKREELVQASAAAVEARDQLVTQADALARARKALGNALVTYHEAIDIAEPVFARARQLAAEIGAPVPAAAARPAGDIAYAQLQCTLHALRCGFLGYAQLLEGPANELALLAILQQAHGLNPVYSSDSPYTLRERLADLRRGDVAKYQARERELAEADRAQSVRARAAYEKKQLEQQRETEEMMFNNAHAPLLFGHGQHAPDAE